MGTLGHERLRRRHHRSEELGGNGDNDHIGIRHRFGDVGGHRQRAGQAMTVEEEPVLVMATDRIGDLGLPSP
jgi:hypothetical protein